MKYLNSTIRAILLQTVLLLIMLSNTLEAQSQHLETTTSEIVYITDFENNKDSLLIWQELDVFTGDTVVCMTPTQARNLMKIDIQRLERGELLRSTFDGYLEAKRAIIKAQNIGKAHETTIGIYKERDRTHIQEKTNMLSDFLRTEKQNKRLKKVIGVGTGIVAGLVAVIIIQ